MLLFAHMIPETYEASSILYISVNKIKTILENNICVENNISGYKQIVERLIKFETIVIFVRLVKVSQYSRIAKNMCFSKKSDTMRLKIQNGLCK